MIVFICVSILLGFINSYVLIFTCFIEYLLLVIWLIKLLYDEPILRYKFLNFLKDCLVVFVLIVGSILIFFIIFIIFNLYIDPVEVYAMERPNSNGNNYNFSADDVRETAKLLLDQKKDIVWNRWGSRNTSVILGETPLWQGTDSASESKKDIIREYVLSHSDQIKKSLFRCPTPIYYELTVNKKLANSMEAWADTFNNN